ncbi:5'/3'-nucleotidase SurE [Salarchaeum japonicum]|uniref:5'/3'-nucleotidase SurE n=1 Tax=Salarchaeum japonicum TaxID=555573 RepID=UPI003C74116A
MSESLDILLTNDDGIDNPGLLAVRDALTDIGDVTVVAPASDQSATGRAMSTDVHVEERDNGYAVQGTPADCVVAGMEALGPTPDLVVAGCNAGANLGMYVLGRSGTVSAAVEAAFFGVPAIAVSRLLEPGQLGSRDLTTDGYQTAANATKYLAENALDAGVFDHADYLNVNAPITGEESGDMHITRPSDAYDMTARRQDATHVTIHDRMWDRVENGTVDDPEGTDRRAVLDGHVSVSPLTAPHSTHQHDALDALAQTY